MCIRLPLVYLLCKFIKYRLPVASCFMCKLPKILSLKKAYISVILNLQNKALVKIKWLLPQTHVPKDSEYTILRKFWFFKNVFLAVSFAVE